MGGKPFGSADSTAVERRGDPDLPPPLPRRQSEETIMTHREMAVGFRFWFQTHSAASIDIVSVQVGI